MTKTLAEEYDALLDEYRSLGRAVRGAGRDYDPTHAARLREVTGTLREMLTHPPEGYTLPPAAAGLIEHARRAGWTTGVQWTPPGWEDELYVKVRVYRPALPTRDPDRPWLYVLTWHSRDCAPGRVRLFGRGLAETPESPRTHDAPSLRAIRAVIDQHPMGA